MFCANCGRKLPEGAGFCDGCGKPVTAKVPPAEPAPEIQDTTPAAEQTPAPDTAAVEITQPPQPKKRSGSRLTVILVIAGVLTVLAVALTALLLWPKKAESPYVAQPNIRPDLNVTIPDVDLDLTIPDIDLDVTIPDIDITYPDLDVTIPSIDITYPSLDATDPQATQPSAPQGLDPSNPYAACLERYSTYVLPTADYAYLSRSDVIGLSVPELTIARYELYARHGKRFNDPQVQAYFDARSWYFPSQNAVVLNEYEVANQILLQVAIQQKNGKFTNPYRDLFPGPETYALPESDSYLAEPQQLQSFSQQQLQMARNEIYARHGYIFGDPQLQAYFYTKSWYRPTTPGAGFSDAYLNYAETTNLALIRIYEQRLAGVKFSSDNPYKSIYSSSVYYLLPNSDSAPVSYDQLKDFSVEKCLLARNEIMARRGYTFADPHLMEYFLQMPWYQPASAPGDSSGIYLTGTEDDNAQLLLETARLRSKLPKNPDTTPTQLVMGELQLTVPKYLLDYVEVTTDSTVALTERISAQEHCGGRLMSFAQVAMGAELPMDNQVLGVLTDTEGNQFQLVVYYPTDVQFHPAIMDFYQQLQRALKEALPTVQYTGAMVYTPT